MTLRLHLRWGCLEILMSCRLQQRSRVRPSARSRLTSSWAVSRPQAESRWRCHGLMQEHSSSERKALSRSSSRCQAEIRVQNSILAQSRYRQGSKCSSSYRGIALRGTWESYTKNGSWRWLGWITNWRLKLIKSPESRKERRTSNRVTSCSKQVVSTWSHLSSVRKRKQLRCFLELTSTKACKAHWSRLTCGMATITFSN